MPAFHLRQEGIPHPVRFLTYYKSDTVTAAYWKELATTDDTLVFYMSSETLNIIVENLLLHHIDADKLLAVVEQATTPLQNVSITSLYQYAATLKEKAFASPTIIIIGKVVAPAS